CKARATEKDEERATRGTEAGEGALNTHRGFGEAPPPRRQPTTVEEPPPTRHPTTNTGPSSCIGSGMAIVGNIECNGPAQVFGRIKGELRASDLLIGDGAQVEGSVIAQDVTVCGRVKGTIRAVR